MKTISRSGSRRRLNLVANRIRPRHRVRLSVLAKDDKEQPIRLLESELRVLKLDLRKTVRAYAAQLEIGLAQITALIAEYRTTNRSPRETLREIRELTILVRKRKPDRALSSRHTLRRIDSLISDLHFVTQPGRSSSEGIPGS